MKYLLGVVVAIICVFVVWDIKEALRILSTAKTNNPMDQVYVSEIRTQTDGRCVVVARGRTSRGAVAVSCQWGTGMLAGSESHNLLGGYIAACGALPGMQGDDC